MKNQLGIMGMLGAVLLCATNAPGALPPKTAPLPNYDKRLELASRAEITRALAAQSGQWDQAATLLRSRVPSAQISRDSIVGAPRLITATHGFLTGPAGLGGAVTSNFLSAIPAGDSHQVVKAFINEHSALFGFSADALISSRITRDYTTDHNGLRTTVWEQTLDGIPVFEGLLASHVTRNGELVSISSEFIPNPANAAGAGTPNRQTLQANPAISAARALALAAANVGDGIQEDSVSVATVPEGVERKQTVTASDLFGPAWMQLVWLPMNAGSMRLCW